jgi:trehalose utilization protein
MHPPPIRITVWHEYRHEHSHEAVRKVYPHGMHVVLADGLRKELGERATVRTATLDEPLHGLTDDVLASTDVLTWWGHMSHADVSDDIARKVHQRVLEGMGLLVLHSAHYSKPFRLLMGTGCGLRWRDAGERERLFVVNPSHEIADGLPPHFDIVHEEMYGEFFDVPPPEELIMLSWFEGGNVFRSCCTWTRGKGKIVYFRPGHELFPTFYQPEIQKVIANAVKWAAPRSSHFYALGAPHEPQSLSLVNTTYVSDESIHRR